MLFILINNVEMSSNNVHIYFCILKHYYLYYLVKNNVNMSKIINIIKLEIYFFYF